MGLIHQQGLLNLEKYIYYEVYYDDKRYGFCSEYDKKKFEEKYSNKFVFKEFNFNYDDLLSTSQLEKLMKLLESNREKIDENKKLNIKAIFFNVYSWIKMYNVFDLKFRVHIFPDFIK